MTWYAALSAAFLRSADGEYISGAEKDPTGWRNHAFNRGHVTSRTARGTIRSVFPQEFNNRRINLIRPLKDRFLPIADYWVD